jgi:hypothetical protein
LEKKKQVQSKKISGNNKMQSKETNNIKESKENKETNKPLTKFQNNSQEDFPSKEKEKKIKVLTMH